jgi:hypothetical protein
MGILPSGTRGLAADLWHDLAGYQFNLAAL